MENESENIEVNSRIYEVGYLLVPTLGEEDVPAVYTKIKDLVVSLGGEIISDDMPKMMNLAYTMQKVVQNARTKYDTAYFGWVKFGMDSSKILELKKSLDADVNIIRFLTLKTIKENTIAAKRFIHRDSKRKVLYTKKEGENESSLPIDKEEIDKEIEAMVA